jgi:anti-sigma regulatory factor (Ser/Thr protein kinase)
LELHLNTADLRVAEVRRNVVQYLRELAGPGADIDAAELIVGELLANVVRHAPGPFELRIGRHGDHAVFEIRDRGAGRPFPPPTTDLLETRGHGMRLVGALARKIEVECMPGKGTTVTVELPVPLRPA